VREGVLQGCWAGLAPGLAQLDAFSLFFVLLIFYFLFFISFISFAFDLQTRSNQFLNFSKIQNDILK
jgi:hypothetical protein